ncbi:MAG: hypothetical protein P8J91_05260 [Pirellulaceae bacterium]|nr:hypothetical protein [Pirellulaceae bacterium]
MSNNDAQLNNPAIEHHMSHDESEFVAAIAHRFAAPSDQGCEFYKESFGETPHHKTRRDASWWKTQTTGRKAQSIGAPRGYLNDPAHTPGATIERFNKSTGADSLSTKIINDQATTIALHMDRRFQNTSNRIQIDLQVA